MDLKTNKDNLLKLNVQGEITHPRLLGDKMYLTTWDGKPKPPVSYGGINYSTRVGDLIFEWLGGDHTEPGVAISNLDQTSNYALSSYSCIGNKAVVITGEGKGKSGLVTGKSGFVSLPDNVLLHFESNVLEKLVIGDKIEVLSLGQGLKIDGFDDVKILGIDPGLLERMGIEVHGEKLHIPVSLEIPPYLMGQGVGERPTEFGYWCIQTNSPRDINEHQLSRLRIGDVVALRDVYCGYGRGYYKGAVTIGVVVHGASNIAGHGPGVNPIITTRGGEVVPSVIDWANIARYLGTRKDLEVKS
jgi:hypothetical protein